MNDLYKGIMILVLTGLTIFLFIIPALLLIDWIETKLRFKRLIKKYPDLKGSTIIFKDKNGVIVDTNLYDKDGKRVYLNLFHDEK